MDKHRDKAAGQANTSKRHQLTLVNVNFNFLDFFLTHPINFFYSFLKYMLKGTHIPAKYFLGPRCPREKWDLPFFFYFIACSPPSRQHSSTLHKPPLFSARGTNN